MLTNEQIAKNKQNYLEIFRENCGDINGVADFLNWLQQTDFFIAPASTKFHGASRGYLCQHSLNVYQAAMELTMNGNLLPKFEMTDSAMANLTLITLGHDVCKANFYVPNPKSYPGAPAYVVEDAFPCGHGEKSVILLQRFIKLKQEEVLAIRWHMGGWDDAVKSNALAYNNARAITPLVDILHISDMIASQLMERDS